MRLGKYKFSSSGSSSGIHELDIIFWILLILKLEGLVDYSWLVVFLPIIIQTIHIFLALIYVAHINNAK